MTASEPAWMTNPHAGPAREICPQCNGTKVSEEFEQQITCECCEGEGMVWADDFPEPYFIGCQCENCTGPVPE